MAMLIILAIANSSNGKYMKVFYVRRRHGQSLGNRDQFRGIGNQASIDKHLVTDSVWRKITGSCRG